MKTALHRLLQLHSARSIILLILSSLFFASCQNRLRMKDQALREIKNDVVYTFSMDRSVRYDPETDQLRYSIDCPVFRETYRNRAFHYPTGDPLLMGDEVTVGGSFSTLQSSVLSNGSDRLNGFNTLVVAQMDDIRSQKYIEGWITRAFSKMGIKAFAASDFITSRASMNPRAIDDLVNELYIDKVLKIEVTDFGYQKYDKEIATETTDVRVTEGKPRMQKDSTIVRDKERTETVTVDYSTQVTEQYAMTYHLEVIDIAKGYPTYEIELKNRLKPGFLGMMPSGNIEMPINNTLFCNYAMYQLIADGIAENQGRAITNLEELKGRVRQYIDFNVISEK